MSNRAQLTGQKFGKLTVLGRGEDYISPIGSHLLRWKCKCECGNTINMTTSQLKRGQTSCGCTSRRENLAGKRFGKLIVQHAVEDYVSPKGFHMSKWHCICDCGAETDVLGMSLKNGDTSSCGKCQRKKPSKKAEIDYAGSTFGDLFVEKKLTDSHPPKYICKCSCGREIEVLQKSLTAGRKTNCGCKSMRKRANHAESADKDSQQEENKLLCQTGRLTSTVKSNTNRAKKKIEYVGLTIGQLTVMEELEPHITPNGSKQRIVKCQCSCGNVFTARITSIKKQQKCGQCAAKERRIDISGKRFGKLVVLSMDDDYVSPTGQRLSRCKCICDCGNTTIVTMSSLVRGTTKSCGCLHNTTGLLKENPALVEKYDYEKNQEIGLDFNSLTARSSRKVWWKCDKCGNSWFATISSQNDRIKHGCPYCSGRLVIPGKTDLMTLYPEIAKEWDYEKNGDLLPNSISAKSNKSVWWKCSEGHRWKATLGNRTNNNSGCPRCKIESINSFCEQAVYFYVKKIYPDAINGDYHLDLELDIYIPSIFTAIEYDGEVWHRTEKRKANDEEKNRICANAGIKLIRIREPRLPTVGNCVVIHRKDTSSSESLNNSIIELFGVLGKPGINVDTDSDTGLILEQFAAKKYDNSLAHCFPEVAAEWHPTKNGNMTPDRINKGSRRIVWWLGICGHEWQSTVGDRTRPITVHQNGRVRKPYGCPYCSGKRLLPGYNDLQTKYPDIASEWHPTRNGDLVPSMIHPGSKKKVWWLGKCGHEWQATPNHRCSDNRKCPICYKKMRSPEVVCVETGHVFSSGTEAANSLGKPNASAIYKCCRNEVNTAYGYHWKYHGKE